MSSGGSSSELEEHTEEGSASEFIPSEVEDVARTTARRTGRAVRRPVPANTSASMEVTENATAANPAAATAASCTLPDAPPTSMRFASTGETAQGTLHQATAASAAAPATPSRPRMSRSATDGALSSTAFPSAAKQCVCDFPGCTKSFSKVGKLNRHKLSHSGSKSFACTHPGCGKQFTRNDRLRRHWKIHQNEAAGGSPAKKRRKIGGAFDGEPATGASAEHAKADSSDMAEESDMMSGSDLEQFVPTAILKANADSTPNLSLVPLLPIALPPTLPPLVKFACSHPGCTLSFLLREHLKRHEPVHAALPGSASIMGPNGTPRRVYPCAHIGCFLTFGKAHKLREHAFVHTGVLPWVCHLPLEDKEHDHDHEDESDDEAHDGDDSMDEAEDEPHSEVAAAETPATADSAPTATVSDTTAAAAESALAATAASAFAPAAAASSSAPQAAPLAAAAAPSAQLGAVAPSAVSSMLLCQEGFMTRAHLFKHQRLCHGPDRHLCSEAGCGATFKRFSELHKHRREVHRSQWLTCSECGLVAATKTEREAHAQTHLTAEQRDKFLLPCPFTMPPHNCTKRFTRKGNLNTHIRGTHDARWKGTMTAPTITGDATDAPEVMVVRFPCPFPVCAQRMELKPYKLKASLQRHLVKSHGLSADDAKDPVAIEHAVHEDLGVPLPAHHSTQRTLTARMQLVGCARPPSKRTGVKRGWADVKEASDEKESGEEGADAPSPSPTAPKPEAKSEAKPEHEAPDAPMLIDSLPAAADNKPRITVDLR